METLDREIAQLLEGKKPEGTQYVVVLDLSRAKGPFDTYAQAQAWADTNDEVYANSFVMPLYPP